MFWKRKSAKVTQAETVYLPKGDWIKLDTKQRFDGGQVLTMQLPLSD